MLTAAELVHEVLVAPRRALVAALDTAVEDRPGWWRLTTPSLAGGALNEVSCTCDPDDATIDETIASYRGQGIHFRWLVGPDAPPGLGDRLARRGLVPSISLGMARATAGASMPASVEEVTAATVDEVTRVSVAGWGSDPSAVAAVHARILGDPARRQQLFLARLDGAVAGTGGFSALERSAYLVGGVVLAAARGRGLYRDLVDARLHAAAARGLGVATTLARADTSAPILTRLGWDVVCEVALYRG